MVRLRITRWRYKHLSFVLLFLSVLWNEYGSHFIATLTWDCQSEFNEQRILIVADPQLIGYNNDLPWVSPIARLDADRYLSTSFSHAVKCVNPSVVVFLGDLFDEGVEASPDQFQATLARFKHIFQSAFDGTVRRVFVAGDNDVGGEEELVQADLVKRLRDSLPDSPQFTLPTVNISELNGFDMSTRSVRGSMSSTIELSLLLSHVPVLPLYGLKNRVVSQIAPDLILSGHDHKANMYMFSRSNDFVNLTHLTDFRGRIVHSVSPRDNVVELQFPTCSYRMGVPHMGYGVVTLRRSASAPFRVEASFLWLPGRYPQLFLYVCLLLLVPLSFAVDYCQSKPFTRKYRYLKLVNQP